ncbi:hypothetical protein PWEIH_10948 [Listeria weihenstephanensis FSL R9-0317]|uniref:hypothetical protein n=1 Tax=Listeria weihenstephanensis TaxID=1006155 RepID=UPI0003E88A58|nr:hypothetical protein [Listeria weihenstephanensis]EUJ37200.1 hypothetical protein PWEIH_10948 [Listeria weihenstephanensis FSL R9-0317]
MIILYLVLAIIALMIITAFYGKFNFKKHWIGVVVIILLLAGTAIFFRQTFFVAGSPYHEIHKEIASTDLSSESVNDIKINQLLDTATQKKDFTSKKSDGQKLAKRDQSTSSEEEGYSNILDFD